MRFQASIFLFALLSLAAASPAQALLSSSPSLKKLVVAGEVRLSPEEATTFDHLSTYKNTRTASDVLSSFSAHIFCTSKLSVEKAKEISKGSVSSIFSESAVKVQGYAKNPPLGYASSKKAVLQAVEMAANHLLFRMEEGREMPGSVFAAMERAAAVAGDYDLALYFVDACATRSRKGNTLTSVVKLSEEIVKMADEAPTRRPNLHPASLKTKNSLAWMELSSALSLAREFAPERWSELNLKAQFADEDDFEEIEELAYESVLSSLAEGRENAEELEDALKKSPELFRRVVEKDFASRVERPLSLERHLLCWGEECRLVTIATNLNPFAINEIVRLCGGVGEVKSGGFAVGDSLFAEVVLGPFQTETLVSSFRRGR